MFANALTGIANTRSRAPQSANLNGSSSIIQSNVPGPFGGSCLYLGGLNSGDYVTVRRGRSNLFGTGNNILSDTGNGTVEFWFRNTGQNYTTTFNVIYDIQEVTTEIRIALRNNNTLNASARFGATTYETSYVALASLGTWNHVAITLTNNVYLTVWINGNRAGEIGNGTDTLITSGGSWNRLFINSPVCYVAEYRMSTNIRYDRANSTYTVPTAKFVNDENTYWLFHFDGNDQLPNDRVVLIGNAQITTSQSKFEDSSISLSAGEDHIIVNPSSEPDTSGDFTLEGWFRFTSAVGDKGLFSKYQASTVGAVAGYNIRYAQSVGGIRSVFGNGSTNNAANFSWTPSINQWYHIACVRNGSTFKVFIDGVEIGSLTLTISIADTAAPLVIGTSQTVATSVFVGFIDEVRISNIARYTSNFTPSSTEFTSDSNTLLLLHGVDSEVLKTGKQCFDDAYYIKRIAQNITAIGNAQVSTAQSKFGGASALFDGNGDYLIIENSSNNLSIDGDPDFTTEAWVRFSSTGRIHTIFSKLPSSGNLSESILRTTTTNLFIFIAFNNGSNIISLTSTTSIVANTWYHVAIVNNSGQWTLYVNGVSEATNTMSATPIGNNSNLLIGRSAESTTRDLSGYIDELRISNTARYTSNFTPSTTAFTNDSNTLLLLHMDGSNSSTTFIDDNG
jgi:hypothetical protein